MSLQFIFGNSGSGKSHVLYKTIIEESIRHPDQNFLVIVPEQFTMQTQRDLVMMHPNKGIMNIDVLSFQRLAHRVFEDVGSDDRAVLTETGKNLMLRRVAEQQKDQLQVLSARLSRIGYISEIKSVLSELMQYEITDFDLEEMIRTASGHPLLKAKLEDIRVLYRAFLEYRRDSFLKPEELMELLADAAGSSKLLKKSVLAFDGFAGFTPSQLHVLRELLAVCPRVYLTVTIDAREEFFGEIREHELFAPSRRLIRSVVDAADGDYEEPIVLGEKELPRFSKNGALRHLEQNLFRSRQEPFTGDSGEISLHALSSPMQEVHFVARTISALVRREGYRYRDIAVIAGDLSAYGSYVRHIFPMYRIPAFVDETHHLLLNPCLEFVRGALSMVLQDFTYESVFRFLRTGMAGITAQETDRLENYVLAAGIRGRKRWEEDWTWCPGGTEQKELDFCNDLRARFMETVGTFAHTMTGGRCPLLVYVDALYQLMADCDVQQQLKDRELALHDASDPEGAEEYRQIYPIVIGLLDEMAELLGEEEMDCREFSDILDAGLSEAKIGIIPQGIDQVQVGDIRRSRLSDIRVLFFVGLNDGWVPASADAGGIVSDTEREILLENGAALAPSARENSYLQRFYLYQNLTKPQDALYLSWCLSGADGTAMRPSYLVSSLLHLFPNLTVQKEEDAGASLSQVTSKENGMLYLIDGLQRLRLGQALAGEEKEAWLELYRQYLNDPAYAARMEELTDAAFVDLIEEKPQLAPQTAQEIFTDDAPAGAMDAGMETPLAPEGALGNSQRQQNRFAMDAGSSMSASITRLELFAGCPFSHFASYGLDLEPRAEYGLRSTDLGTLFHEAMELFSEQMRAKGLDWGTCPYEEQAALMDRCVDQAAASYSGGILFQSAREAYTIRRLKRILRRTLQATDRQIRAGKFTPVGFEIPFADTRDLNAVQLRSGSVAIRLQGRIDRIDTAEGKDRVYVKVVDYKSGRTKFDLVPAYYGLQIQLLVYMNAALEMEQKLHPGKQAVPAGVFYSLMQDPVLDYEKEPGRAMEKLYREMRPSGLINGDEPVLQLLDQDLAASQDSLVIPAGLKKDGTPKASSSLVTSGELAALSSHVTNLLQKMSSAILDGSIAAKPFTDKNTCACDYCIYADVCGFDRKIPGRCSPRTPSLSAEEIRKRLKEGDRA